MISDADHQLLIQIAFQGKVKVHSFQLDAPDDGRGPKEIRLFVNLSSPSFDDVEAHDATYTKELGPADFGTKIELPFVKFQSVNSLTFFVESNQEESDDEGSSAMLAAAFSRRPNCQTAGVAAPRR